MKDDEKPLGRAEDLSNKIFNFLQPLYRTQDVNLRVAWKCKCLKCGKETTARADHIKDGSKKSCGCYQSENGIRHFKSIRPPKEQNQKDITGLKSGYLVAIGPTEKRYAKSNVVWKCQCLNPIHTIPVYCEAFTTQIIQQKKRSCGCVKSFGEAEIANILTQYHIPFERQKTFNDCCLEEHHPMRFDFYVNNQYLIEYDGSQHFQASGGWNSKEQLADTQKRDRFKNQWCLANNIPLIRIPYTHLKDLNIKDLLLDSSSFIVKVM